jgi:hypothetical protein
MPLRLIKHYIMKTYRGVKVQFHAFLILAQDGAAPPIPNGYQAWWTTQVVWKMRGTEKHVPLPGILAGISVVQIAG